MRKREGTLRDEDLDGLRLFALGRIPRCIDCSRYRALAAVYTGSTHFATTLPPIPESCSHQVCTPLVDRLRSPLRVISRPPGKAACGL